MCDTVMMYMSCRESDEHHKTVHADGVVNNLGDFVDMLLTHQPHPHK